MLPPSIGSSVPQDSPARVVSDTIDKLYMWEVGDTYIGGTGQGE